MKNLFVILFFIFPQLIFSQEKSVFNPVSQLNGTESIKIILVSADWCQICDKTKKLLNNSDQIKSFLSSELQLFVFDTEKEESIVINKKTYSYVPSGLKSGRHEFLSFLLEEGKVVSYPTIVILSPSNKIIQRYQGYLTEKEWTTLLISLVN